MMRAYQFVAPPTWVFFLAVLACVCAGHGCGDIAYAQPAPAEAAAAPAHAEPHPAAPMQIPSELMLPDVRVALQPRALAPFEGVLFDPPTLVRWAQRIQWLEHRLELEHELHVQLEEATRASYQELTVQLTESYEREISTDRQIIDETQAALDRAHARLAELERRPPHRAFAIGTGFGAVMVLTAVIVGTVAH
jgi:hypothetical protein